MNHFDELEVLVKKKVSHGLIFKNQKILPLYLFEKYLRTSITNVDTDGFYPLYYYQGFMENEHGEKFFGRGFLNTVFINYYYPDPDCVNIYANGTDVSVSGISEDPNTSFFISELLEVAKKIDLNGQINDLNKGYVILSELDAYFIELSQYKRNFFIRYEDAIEIAEKNNLLPDHRILEKCIKIDEINQSNEVNATKPLPTQQKNAYLKTIYALSDALVGGLTGKNRKDAQIIIEALDKKGVKAPSDKTLEKYLGEAKELLD